MNNIGARLRDERERLGKNQDAFAALAGIGKRALIHYEKSERSPDANFLAAIATAGADVLYILTGQRIEGTASDPAEQVLLDSYRRCKPDAKANLIQTAALLSAGVAPGPAPKAAPCAGGGVQMSASAQPSIAVRGSRNVVAGRDVVQTKVRK